MKSSTEKCRMKWERKGVCVKEAAGSCPWLEANMCPYPEICREHPERLCGIDSESSSALAD